MVLYTMMDIVEYEASCRKFSGAKGSVRNLDLYYTCMCLLSSIIYLCCVPYYIPITSPCFLCCSHETVSWGRDMENR